ncbi:MAG: hypothetical protein AB1330_12540 [Bacillota bacterium]
MPLFGLAVAALVLADIGTRGWGLQAANQWDILLGVFNNPFVVVVLLPVIFWAIVLGSVAANREEWEYMMLVRLPSRAVWWWSRIGAMGAASLVYTGVLFVCVILVSVPAVSLEWSWSQLVLLSGWTYPGGLPMSQLYTPPPIILVKIFGLIWLALFALGTAVAALGFVTRRVAVGWVAGAVSALISYGTWLVAPHFAPWAPTLQMLLSAHQGFNDGVPGSPALWWSAVMYGILLVGSASVGHLFAFRRDL